MMEEQRQKLTASLRFAKRQRREKRERAGGFSVSIMDEATTARQVSLVHRLVVPFHGSVIPDSIALGDVDGDGCIELVVGTTQGRLVVLKGSRVVVEKFGLGTIKCVFVDDFLGAGRACVVVLSAEGQGFVLDFARGDGTDCVMRGFSIPWNVTAGVHCNLALDFGSSNRTRALVLASHDGGALSQSKVTVLSLSIAPPPKEENVSEPDSNAADAQATTHDEWLLDQGAAVSLSYCKVGVCELILVGLNFGGMISIDLRTRSVLGHRFSNDSDECTVAKYAHYGFSEEDEEDDESYVAVEKPTFVVGDIVAYPDQTPTIEEGESEQVHHVALCFGGRLRLERFFLQQADRNTRLELVNQLAWQEHQTRQLFSLQSLDINGDGRHEIVSCAWDGLTCIYDIDKNIVRFQFQERVQAFLAGHYTHAYPDTNSGENTKTNVCFVYVTLDGEIFIYTGVNECIRSIPALTMVDVLRQRGQLEHVLNKLDPSHSSGGNNNPSYLDEVYCAKLLHQALYERSPLIKADRDAKNKNVGKTDESSSLGGVLASDIK